MILCADGLAFSGLLSGLVAGCLEGLRSRWRAPQKLYQFELEGKARSSGSSAVKYSYEKPVMFRLKKPLMA